MARRVILFAAVTWCFAGTYVRAQSMLQSSDPLSLTPPVAVFRGFVPSSTSAESKLTEELWRTVAASPDQESEVIVLLVEPLAPMVLALQDPAIEADRVAQIALLEHQLVEQARTLGFSETLALSHLPVVIGRIENRRVLDLAALPHVRAIEPVRILSVSRSEGAALIKANQLRTQFGGTGAGADVAVLDSGISFAHPEVTPNLEVHADYTGTTGNGNDDNGHGTSVAGIIAGVSGGMAPQADLWALKVTKADGTGTSAALLQGLNGAYAARDQFGGLDLVNMSLGGLGPGNTPFNSDCDSQAPAEATVINQLVAAGIAVFAASGNEGCNGIAFPGCLSGVISVGAVYDANIGPAGFGNVRCDPTGTCDDLATAADKITCYSNSGVPLDILAPSHCANAPGLGTSNNSCFGGTSAASPYAAGVAAQIRSLRPATTPSQLRQALTTTGKPLTDVNGITRNRIDAVAAFQALGGGGNAGPCVRDADTACLLANRFEVEVDWQTSSSSGVGQVMSFGGQRTENEESVFWWFFSPTNFEMGVKVLNACVPFLGNKYWVFVSGLTDQGWTVHVRDTQTGATRTYANAVGHLSTTFADTGAFNCP